jgi:hypothetical protein
VFFNGTEQQPDKQTLRLSDACKYAPDFNADLVFAELAQRKLTAE